MIVSIRANLDYAVDGAAPVLMQIEAADLPDQHVVKSQLDIEDAIDFVRWRPKRVSASAASSG